MILISVRASLFGLIISFWRRCVLPCSWFLFPRVLFAGRVARTMFWSCYWRLQLSSDDARRQPPPPNLTEASQTFMSAPPNKLAGRVRPRISARAALSGAHRRQRARSRGGRSLRCSSKPQLFSQWLSSVCSIDCTNAIGISNRRATSIFYRACGRAVFRLCGLHLSSRPDAECLRRNNWKRSRCRQRNHRSLPAIWTVTPEPVRLRLLGRARA